MSNLHTPERQANETRAEYVARRKASQDLADKIGMRGKYARFGGINQRRQLRANTDMQKRTRAADVILAYFAEKRLAAMNAAKAKKAA